MIHLLEREYELILNDQIREFVVDALSKKHEIDEDHFDIRRTEYIRNVVSFSRTIGKSIDADDIILDMVIAAGFLHDTMNDYSILHPFQVRIFLNDLMPLIGRDIFDNIMFLIERQQGFACPIAEVRVKVDDPIHAWILPIAIALAKKGT
jgi:hypothetical protein